MFLKIIDERMKWENKWASITLKVTSPVLSVIWRSAGTIHLLRKESHNSITDTPSFMGVPFLAPSVHVNDYLFLALSRLCQLCLASPMISVVTWLLWCHLYNSVLRVSMCKSCLLHTTICHCLFPEPFTILLSPFTF